MSWPRSAWIFLFVLFVSLGAASLARADRDASFLAPNAATTGSMSRNEGAVSIEPKAEIDLGDTGLNVAKRTTLFFVNQTNLPVGIVTITANGDSNVDATIVADDCSKGGKIAPSSKCAVSVEVTPKGSGQWTAEVLMTHDAAGRLARAKLSGKTSGTNDKKNTGLSLSTKDVKAIDFGKVQLGSGKAVRSALMVNDSNAPITVLSIEVIAAENGLTKLDQGCIEDMDLAPGDSCPVTLMWNPEKTGMVSTDLIIRHTGPMGFAVIPIRGESDEPKDTEIAGGKKDDGKGGKAGADKVSLSPSADDIEKMMNGKIQALSSSALGSEAESASRSSAPKKESADMDVHLIGTVGNRALLYCEGKTNVVGVGEEMPVGDGKLKLVDVASKQATILLDGKKKLLDLEAVADLTSKAAKAREQRDKTTSSPTTGARKAKQPATTKKGDDQSSTATGGP